MKALSLEKNISLYKAQFDKYMNELYGDYRLDRLSMDLDAILFRIKYMNKKNIDQNKIPELEEEFNTKAQQMRQCFSEFMYNFLTNIIQTPKEFSIDNLIDVLAQDVKINSTHVNFHMIVISDSIEYLEYLDSLFKDDETYNMFPDEYFRFYTDSYNDGIAKAYPELFENKEQDEIGVGNDKDVFVHSFTFQTSERCSLSCLYCISGDALIHTKYNTRIPIANIKKGDEIIGFDENFKLEYDKISGKPKKQKRTFKPVKVKKVFQREEALCYEIFSPYLSRVLTITPNHKVLTDKGWVAIEDLYTPYHKIAFKQSDQIVFNSNYLIKASNIPRMVYNLETTSGTYIANNLCVHNCYQFNKSLMRMEFDTAKKFIDNLLNNEYGYINQYNSPAIILEFIGGEPLLEITLTRKIYEYFLDKCYELNHPWFTMHRLSICSNGMQYFDDEVQSFFQDYSSQISFNISIDGNKELHDSCRIQTNGEGSYDICIAALKHYTEHYVPERNSKMTLAPSNIKYLSESVIDFINNGMSVINLNCVFEEGWNNKTALIEYEELKKLADYILENNLENIYISIFNERQEGPYGKEMDSNFCGATGSMLALRPNGQFYSCIRFMPTSVGDNVGDLCLGDIDSGFIEREDDSPILKVMDNITRRSQTNDICYECPIANSCMSCTALNHTVFGTPDKRTTFTCIQVKAESLANVYYWNLLSIKHPEYHLPVRKIMIPDDWALEVISESELVFLKNLESLAAITYMENEESKE